MALIALSVSMEATMAQIGTPPEIAVDPDLPVKEGFDVERAYLGRAPLFTPLRDPEWESLRDARRAATCTRTTYHHVAQGEMAGEPWMVTF